MKYYLIYGKQTSEDFIYDINQIGHINDYKKFYPEKGFEIIKKLIDLNESVILNKIKIESEDHKEKYNIQEFIDFLSKHKIKIITQ